MSRSNLKQIQRLQNPVARSSGEWNVQWCQKQHQGPKAREMSLPCNLYSLRCMSFWTPNGTVSIEWNLLFSQWLRSCRSADYCIHSTLHQIRLFWPQCYRIDFFFIGSETIFDAFRHFEKSFDKIAQLDRLISLATRCGKGRKSRDLAMPVYLIADIWHARYRRFCTPIAAENRNCRTWHTRRFSPIATINV